MTSGWISLEDSRQYCRGNIAWWKCEGPNGVILEERQHDPRGPPDLPVYMYPNGDMYLGQWKKYGAFTRKSKPGGLGVYCSQGECVFIGQWEKGRLNGLTKLLWLPASICWTKNDDIGSEIQDQNEKSVPYIYMGLFHEDMKEDKAATVILKDGTTRIGPFKADRPVGNWWKDHKAQPNTTPERIMKLLSFGGEGETASTAKVVANDATQAGTVQKFVPEHAPVVPIAPSTANLEETSNHHRRSSSVEDSSFMNAQQRMLPHAKEHDGPQQQQQQQRKKATAKKITQEQQPVTRRSSTGGISPQQSKKQQQAQAQLELQQKQYKKQQELMRMERENPKKKKTSPKSGRKSPPAAHAVASEQMATTPPTTAKQPVEFTAPVRTHSDDGVSMRVIPQRGDDYTLTTAVSLSPSRRVQQPYVQMPQAQVDEFQQIILNKRSNNKEDNNNMEQQRGERARQSPGRQITDNTTSAVPRFGAPRRHLSDDGVSMRVVAPPKQQLHDDCTLATNTLQPSQMPSQMPLVSSLQSEQERIQKLLMQKQEELLRKEKKLEQERLHLEQERLRELQEIEARRKQQAIEERRRKQAALELEERRRKLAEEEELRRRQEEKEREERRRKKEEREREERKRKQREQEELLRRQKELERRMKQEQEERRRQQEIKEREALKQEQEKLKQLQEQLKLKIEKQQKRLEKKQKKKLLQKQQKQQNRQNQESSEFDEEQALMDAVMAGMANAAGEDSERTDLDAAPLAPTRQMTGDVERVVPAGFGDRQQIRHGNGEDLAAEIETPQHISDEIAGSMSPTSHVVVVANPEDGKLGKHAQLDASTSSRRMFTAASDFEDSEVRSQLRKDQSEKPSNRREVDKPLLNRTNSHMETLDDEDLSFVETSSDVIRITVEDRPASPSRNFLNKDESKAYASSEDEATVSSEEEDDDKPLVNQTNSRMEDVSPKRTPGFLESNDSGPSPPRIFFDTEPEVSAIQEKHPTEKTHGGTHEQVLHNRQSMSKAEEVVAAISVTDCHLDFERLPVRHVNVESPVCRSDNMTIRLEAQQRPFLSMTEF